MIEVEKKFQPTEEQTRKLTEGALLISKKNVIDIYYDTAKFDFAKKSMWLRNRDGIWELKAYSSYGGTGKSEVADEILDEIEIIKKLGYSTNFISVNQLAEKLIILGKINTERKKYSREGFVIDFDITDFGLNKTDIELLVDDESKIEEANQKIISFAKQFDLIEVDIPTKPAEYLRRMRPESYNEILGNNNEMKNRMK